MALERPKYSLVKKVSGLELREYEPYQIAVCNVQNVSDLNRASNAGFRYLFNYISGENADAQKISMTVPVQQTPTKNGWMISFVVPQKFLETGAPIPRNAKVEIQKIEAGTFAALKYRGLWNSNQFEAKKKLLLSKLAELGLKPVGEVTAAVFNPPLTPPMFRHNEVMVRIQKAKS